MKQIFLSIIMVLIGGACLAMTGQQYAEKIIKVRGQVESLNMDYEAKKETYLSDIKSYSLQKADLEGQLRSEEMRKKRLLERINIHKKSLADVGHLDSEVLPILSEKLLQVEETMIQSLPFKKEERQKSLNTLKEKLNKKEITPLNALKELWTLIEDEKRFNSEVLIAQQAIEIEGENHLSEMVKLGSQFLYFRLNDGRVGQFVSHRKGQNFVLMTDADQKKQVDDIFLAIKRQVREGEYQLPQSI